MIICGRNSVVECNLPKVDVEGSNPFVRLFIFELDCERGENTPQDDSLVRVRAACEQSAEDFSLEETKFLKRKSADTFNANKSRKPLRPLIYF